MTPVIVQATIISVGGIPDSTVNATSNFTGGNTAFFIHNEWNGVPTGVTIAGAASTRDATAALGGGDGYAIWRIDNVAGGRNDVALAGDSGGYISGAILEVSGLIASPLDQISSAASGTSNAPSATTGSTTQAEGIAIAIWANGNDDNGSLAPSGWTNLFNPTSAGGGEGGSAAYKILSSIGAQTATFAVNGGGSVQWACRVLTYKAAAGGGGSVSDSFEGAAARQVRTNAVYRMSPRSEREAQQFLRAQKRAFSFARAA